jgi:hypothetical protein
MDAAAGGQLIGLGGQVLTGAIGELFAAADDKEQERLMKMAQDEYGRISIPKLEQIVAQEMGPTELSKINTDPQYKNMQLDSLNELQNVIKGGGYSLQDQANLNAVRGKIARTNAAGNSRIAEDLNLRGQGGGGAELTMQLNNQQNSAQRASDEGMKTAGEGQARALDAMLSRGRLAGDMHREEYSEKERAAMAQDRINERNFGAKEKAAYYNAGLNQQDFDNRYKKASGVAGGLQNRAVMAGNRANSHRQLWGGVGQAVKEGGTLGGKLAESNASPSAGGANPNAEWASPFPDRSNSYYSPPPPPPPSSSQSQDEEDWWNSRPKKAY